MSEVKKPIREKEEELADLAAAQEVDVDNYNASSVTKQSSTCSAATTAAPVTTIATSARPDGDAAATSIEIRRAIREDLERAKGGHRSTPRYRTAQTKTDTSVPGAHSAAPVKTQKKGLTSHSRSQFPAEKFGNEAIVGAAGCARVGSPPASPNVEPTTPAIDEQDIHIPRADAESSVDSVEVGVSEGLSEIHHDNAGDATGNQEREESLVEAFLVTPNSNLSEGHPLSLEAPIAEVVNTEDNPMISRRTLRRYFLAFLCVVVIAIAAVVAVLVSNNKSSGENGSVNPTQRRPSSAPSASPTTAPSSPPTGNPSGVPSAVPSSSPSDSPTGQPSQSPSGSPSGSPSTYPTGNPSESPSVTPSDTPTGQPSQSPSGSPSGYPSTHPTGNPSQSPSDFPSGAPTSPAPTSLPSFSPSALPTMMPSAAPTALPDIFPLSTRQAIERDPQSPQAKAMSWLMGHPDFNNESGMPNWRKLQLFALVALYHALQGDNWPYAERRYYLNYDVSECQWGDTMVENPADRDSFDDPNECRDDQLRLTQLRLDFFGGVAALRGEIPDEILFLSSLESLEIVDTGYMASLHDLIADHLVHFVNLTRLDLSMNAMAGSIPTQIGLLTKLERLKLNKNSMLTGSLPSELRLLTDLTRLYLEHTGITGVIPSQLCRLSASQLRIDCAKIVCPEDCGCRCSRSKPTTSSPTWAPTISPAPVTRTTPVLGLLPDYTLESLQNLSSPQSIAFTWLDAHPDKETMEDWRKLQLFALVSFYYAFQGDRWPDRNDRANFMSYTVSECRWGGNSCHPDGRVARLGVGPWNLAYDADTLEVKSAKELSFLTSLETIIFVDTNFEASLRDVLPEEMKSLVNLTIVELESNYLHGSIPSHVADLTALASLSLGSNQLQEKIPSELGMLNSLEELHLNDNGFTGTIPTELGVLTKLSTLSLQENDLWGTVPPTFGRMSLLTSLQLHGNSLSGSLPAELGTMQALETLHLRGGELSGTIPFVWWSAMTSLTSLDLSENILSGFISSEIGLLSQLTALSLAENILISGTLPSELALMTGLQTLEVHKTLIRGDLPSGICGLSRLTTLRVNCENVNCPAACNCMCT